MKILHVIRDPNERLGLEIAERQSEHDAVSLLLIQDGVLIRRPSGRVTVYVMADAEGSGEARAVDDEGAVRLVAEHDKVIVW